MAVSFLLLCTQQLPSSAVPGRAARAASLPDPAALWVPFVRDGNVWAIDALGRSERQLSFSGRDWAPVPSPDGTRVAYLSAPEGPPGAPSAWEIRVVALDGGEPILLTSRPGMTSTPAWAPDGQRVAFVEDAQLVVTDLRDMERRVVATGARFAGLGVPRPAWSPDGRRLACVLQGDGQPGLWLIDPDDGSREALAVGEYQDLPYSFAPNQDVAYLVGSDLYMVTSGQEGRAWMRDVANWAWSRQGEWLAVRRAGGSLWVGQGDGEGLREVAGQAEIEFWLPDGSLAYHKAGALYRTDGPGIVDDRLVDLGRPPAPPVSIQDLFTGTLDAPWRTQFEGICGGTNCGPSSLGISMDYLGEHHSNDAIRRAINVYLRGGEANCGSGTTFSSLRWYARQYAGLATMERAGEWSLQDITAQIAQGHPVVLLVHYKSLPGHETSSYQWDHFIVFQGIRADGLVSYDDPAFSYAYQGSNRTMTQAQLMNAWTSCVGGNPQQSAMAFYRPGAGPDTTPPDGDIVDPGEHVTVTSRLVHLAGWAADDQSGFHHAHFTANLYGDWRQIEPDFTASPFSLDWQMCNDWVPDGPVTVGLEVWDHAGNQATSPRGAVQFTKAYDCTAPPTGARWQARYFAGSACWDDPDCAAAPRCSEAIDGLELHKEWGRSAPCVGLAGQDWVGEFTTTVDLPAGEYVFRIEHGTGARLWLDGQPVLDRATGGHGPVCNGQGGFVLDGETEVRVLTRGGNADAWLHLTWDTGTGACVAPPTADFQVSPLSGPAPLQVTLGNLSAGQYASCHWQYGDGSAGDSCAGEHGHTYAGPGTYTVRLAVTGPGGTGAKVQTDAVHASGSVPPPVARLDAAPLAGAAPLQVALSNRSSGSFTGCSWAYGDGSTSTGCADHEHVYAAAGSYPVSLTVEGPGGSATSALAFSVEAGVPPSCEPGTDRVALYAGAGYSGGCVVLGAGAYANAAYLAPLGDDDVESIRVGSDVQAMLYAESSYGGRSEVMTGFDADLRDNAIGTNAVSSVRVQARDTEPPSVAWAAPTSSMQVYDVGGQVLELEASAADNVGVDRVRFYRWDHPAQQFREVGSARTAPYRVSLDCADLGDGWNQVLVQAYDVAGNVSAWDYIWLARDAPLPDLRPWARPGYEDAVVTAPVTGTTANSPLAAGRPAYLDWYLGNAGDAPAAGSFDAELWVDGVLLVRAPFADLLPGATVGADDWAYTLPTAGWHEVRLVVDPGDAIAESDEANNVWEGQVYWAGSAPYADDVESGSGQWVASGLWHQVDGSSAYARAHSGTHSWWYGQESSGNYDTGAANAGDLTTPPLYVPSAAYRLRFWYRYETETPWRGWDRREVQIAVDGRPFSVLAQLYDDPSNFWLQSQAIDLSGLAGHVVQVRFHFETLDGLANGYRGWYVDDVSISTSAPPACGDAHEPNDAPDGATAIAYGQTVHADICPGGDYDWYTFTGWAGDQITVDIDARSDGSTLDAYVFVLDGDGVAVLAENDDAVVEQVQDPLLVYRLPYDGRYTIKVRAWDHPSVGSTDHFYTLRLLGETLFTDLPERTYMPLIVRAR